MAKTARDMEMCTCKGRWEFYVEKMEHVGGFFREPQHKGRSGGALWIPN